MRNALVLVLTVLLGGCSPGTAASGSACGIAAAEVGQFAEIPAGILEGVSDARYPEERRQVPVRIDAFRIQVHEVTNDQFSAFVDAVGYVTDAERSVAQERPDAGSAVFLSGRWHLVPGASWKSPEGPASDISGRGRHPVVHVTRSDAAAYAAWAGGRLPSEEEWEYAARLGLPDPGRDTSGAFAEDGTPRANTWQGFFPFSDTGADGFTGRAPSGCYPADRAGLYDMIGNVWEWTDTPFGPGTGTIRGGSHLCAENFCQRYRPAARQPQEIDFSSSHIGFRIVMDAD